MAEIEASISKKLASFAVVVDAIDLKAVGFYQRHGFIEFTENPLKLYLPLETIEGSIEIAPTPKSQG